MISEKGLIFRSLVAATLLCLVMSDEERPANTCPSTSEVYPCTCKMDYDGSCIIMCYGVKMDALEKLAKIPNLCNGDVEFVLLHSKVQGIPGELWKSLLASKAVDVTIKYSTVEYLVSPDYGQLPELYSPTSAEIKVVNAGNVDKWQWEQLHKFLAAEGLTLIIDNTPITALPESFSKIGKSFVTKLAVDMNGLTELPEEVFKSFNMLRSLSLQNNKLTQIKRSAIPQPASELTFLALNGNYLTSLPEDLFADMPSLTTVYLRDNALTTLPNNIFKLANSNSLRLINMINNPWHCDCSLMWNVGNSTTHTSMGKCASPDSVKDKVFKKAKSLLEC